MFLADAVARDLEYLAADEGGLAGVREIDAFRAGDPAGPSFYPAGAVSMMYHERDEAWKRRAASITADLSDELRRNT